MGPEATATLPGGRTWIHTVEVTAIRARVRDGRLIVDAPTDLPDGLELNLAIVDDDLDDAERAELDASLEESYAQMDRGELVDARSVLASLRTAKPSQ